MIRLITEATAGVVHVCCLYSETRGDMVLVVAWGVARWERTRRVSK